MYSNEYYNPSQNQFSNNFKIFLYGNQKEKNNALDTYFNGGEVEISDNEDVDEVFIDNGTGDWCHIAVKHQTIEV